MRSRHSRTGQLADSGQPGAVNAVVRHAQFVAHLVEGEVQRVPHGSSPCDRPGDRARYDRRRPDAKIRLTFDAAVLDRPGDEIRVDRWESLCLAM
jgi:hypothetical protein